MGAKEESLCEHYGSFMEAKEEFLRDLCRSYVGGAISELIK
jgi:hypothetical protein